MIQDVFPFFVHLLSSELCCHLDVILHSVKMRDFKAGCLSARAALTLIVLLLHSGKIDHLKLEGFYATTTFFLCSLYFPQLSSFHFTTFLQVPTLDVMLETP